MLKAIEVQAKNRVERLAKSDYKLIKLPSTYNKNHKNTFNSYNKIESVFNADYTLRMLKNFMPVKSKMYLKNRVVKSLLKIDYIQAIYIRKFELL